QNTSKHFSIVHSLDGYDEISLTGDFKLISNRSEELISADQLGFQSLKQEQLHGGETIEDAAAIFSSILGGNGTEAQESAVLANAGLAVATVEQCSYEEAIDKAKESLKGGNALKSFKNFLQVNS
ncbi:MAG: anthranilate phosphoribosyltransferase, partial [Ekhidna sp.]|nr:anthranilate phosphoribosyltransferase [Ekhidna sp.]